MVGQTEQTLQQWCDRYGVIPTHPTSERGAVSILIGPVELQDRPGLWSLKDYAVSSVCGPVVWLVPVPRLNVGINDSGRMA